MQKLNSNSGRFNKLYWLGLFAVLVILLASFSHWILEGIWLGHLGYSSVFWTIKEAQVGLWIVGFLIVFVYIWLNGRHLVTNLLKADLTGSPLENLEYWLQQQPKAIKAVRRIILLISIFLGFFFATQALSLWEHLFRFLTSPTFGTTDPVFGRDISFFVFEYPFINDIQNTLAALIFLVIIAAGIIYLYSGQIKLSNRGLQMPTHVRRHLALNLAFWLLFLSWGYYLDRYGLLMDSGGLVYGAGYTDIMVNLPSLWIATLGTLALAFMLGAYAFRLLKSFRYIVFSAIGLIVIIVLGLNLLPAAVQSFSVSPNELQLERPYLEHNINMTRKAYGINEIKEKNYEANDTLTYAQIRDEDPTINNIRLWDPRLLIQTYRQLQEIRLYYQFYSVDVDRYQTNEGYRQVMLAARELSDDLPEQADTWVNRRLQYTHGYGLVMSPVAEQSGDGEPLLSIKDIPPVSTNGLDVDQAAVYYGEHQSDYRIVNSGIKELDYPKGDQNVYNNYSGHGGIKISSFWRKLLLSWELGDINFLLTGYIHEDSRVQLWRSVQERIHKIAPFLKLDEDPYLVLNNGKLLWVQDAYTTSRHYPYSERYNGQFNYVRNSVKIVVDAYQGDVNFYTIDQNDPVLKVYRKTFPDLFKPMSAMPEGLQAHMRYPKDLFDIQVQMYNKYHMTDPQVFYNNEDLWTRPTEKYAGQSRTMEPYYVLSTLPGSNQLQYMLFTPLTPNNRDNMIAWMAATSDQPNYGDLVVYKLPKERLIYGPAQVEARIDQDTEISQQLSLWDQRGSSVIRGNLMVIPIEDSFLYVEPVFLIAEDVDIPQMQRVIVASGDGVTMQPTLRQSLAVLFNKEELAQQRPTGKTTPNRALPPATLQKLNQLQSQWQQLQDALRSGDWSQFGDRMNQLEQLFKDTQSLPTVPDSVRN